MPPLHQRPLSPLDNEARFEVAAPTTLTPVAIALVAIVAAGLVGLYRGVISVREDVAGLVSLPTTGAIVGAQPATPLPHNPDWSTLSGPVVLPPPAPKAHKVEEAADSGDETEADSSEAGQVMSSGDEAAEQQPAAPVTPAPPVVTGPLSQPPQRR